MQPIDINPEDLADLLRAMSRVYSLCRKLGLPEIAATADAQPVIRPAGKRHPGPAKVWRPFSEAREFARSLNLSTTNEWWQWSKSGQRPADIPAGPRVYVEFAGYPDWLGYQPQGTALGRAGKKFKRPERVSIDETKIGVN